VTDALSPDRVVPLLRGRFGKPYRFVESCPSTQLLLGADDPEGAVVACEEQTAGRGRLDRRWHAPAGAAILCSVLLRPPDRRLAPQLSLVAAVAVADTVERAAGLSAELKWPNDVLLGGGKVAGILAEGRSGLVVVGIGLNVSQRAEQLPVRASIPAASLLTATGSRHERAPLLAALLQRLEEDYERWLDGGLESLAADFRSRDALFGREVEVDGLRGRAGGIASGGELMLETPAGVVLVASGEVLVG
jgi:BirA family biotin operon repressor/biotin-[acetyl-CoA-carboxylase] ligase